MYAIVGAGGFFGTYIVKYILEHTSESILALTHSTVLPDTDGRVNSVRFEITDKQSLKKAGALIRSYNDIKLIYLVSSHNPDFIKHHEQQSHEINTNLYANFIKCISNADISSFIYASSDTVYGESKNGEVFTESSKTQPVNIYGIHKKEAESITLAEGFSVARFSYMSGRSLCSDKKHFFDVAAEHLSNGEAFSFLADYVRNALSYTAAAECVVSLCENENVPSVINICADKPTSKYDMGKLIAEYVNAEPSLVQPASFEQLGIFDEKRAKSILMNNSLLKTVLCTNKPIVLQYT